jgi:hypothetical protein
MWLEAIEKVQGRHHFLPAKTDRKLQLKLPENCGLKVL